MRSKDTKTIDDVLAWVDSIRNSDFGHSQNEKKLILLANEVLRLRLELLDLKRKSTVR